MIYDLQAMRLDAEHIAQAAGAVIRQHFNQPHEETIKSNIFDVVTEGDKASEAVILAELHRLYPTVAIVSEEGGGELTNSEYCWFIDPIDGTTNFANNIPFFSVSIGLAETATRLPVVGAVLNPITGELFSAAKGHGATLNGQPIQVSKADNLNRTVFASGFAYARQTAEDNNLRAWEAMLMHVRDLRRMGSAALDLCYVAAGRFDGYWERYINSWDVSAGLAILYEAGGTASDYSGSTEKLYTGNEVVATNGLLHKATLQILNSVRE